MNKKKLIIFDFDGTIADSFSVLVEIINELSKEEGLDQFSADQIEKARDLPMREIIFQLKLSKWKLFFLARKIQKKFAQKISQVRPIEGIVPVLAALKEKGYVLGVLSSSRKEILDQFMRNNKIAVFTFMHSEKNLFGKAKILKKILKEYAFVPSEAVYVGDESRDIDAAKEAEMESVSVSWGFNSKKMLAENKPDYLIDKPEGLLEIL
ncbi:MAG: HAD hydrolase-like protein [Candidatus Moranbacteria bacterium]|nr:HAD hydrolase-like protein [Candidatus Moranbacteria bacterium]